MTRLRAAVIGARAAWSAPGWLEHLEPKDFTAAARPDAETGVRSVDVALRSAWFTLRLLARLRPTRWRTSCLFRSAAECIALTQCGVPAGVGIGVRGEPGEPIAAHAWLEAPEARPSGDGRYALFHPAAAEDRGRQ